MEGHKIVESRPAEQLERIEHPKPKTSKSRDKIVNRNTTAKSFRSWIKSSISLLKKDKNITHAVFLEAVLKQYDFYLERDKIIVGGWKGKSGLEIIEKPDCFVIVRHQKIEKDGTPEKILAEIEKSEVNLVIASINRLNENIEPNKKGERWIETRDIGEMTYQLNWDEGIFPNRKLHHKLTYILNILEYYNMTKYSRSGKTMILNESETIQEVLKK